MKKANIFEKIVLKGMNLISKPEKVSAHCDIPCGIYETDSMKQAAETVCKMMEKMNELEKNKPSDPKAK
ncbi:MAG: superoxide dismutase [Ni], partial [Candidatus Diapherotrites archaeon]|nr:superoxide dismutase [Ni] [Candidatus Diapherotrites archaeon]